MQEKGILFLLNLKPIICLTTSVADKENDKNTEREKKQKKYINIGCVMKCSKSEATFFGRTRLFGNGANKLLLLHKMIKVEFCFKRIIAANFIIAKFSN